MQEIEKAAQEVLDKGEKGATKIANDGIDAVKTAFELATFTTKTIITSSLSAGKSIVNFFKGLFS